MKPPSPTPNDNLLTEALHEWKVEAKLPPRFQDQVWRRIEARELPAQPSVGSLLWDRLTAALRRPSLAVGYVTALLLTGLAAGYLQVRHTQTQANEDMGTRYLQMVAPFQGPRH